MKSPTSGGLVGAILICLGLFASSLAYAAGDPQPPQPSTPAATPTPDVRQTLDEMASLEAQIEKAQRQHWDEQRRLFDANRSLRSIQSNLENKVRMQDQGLQFFQLRDEQTREDLQAIERDAAESRAILRGARESLRLSSTAIFAATASPSPPPSSLLTLALLQGSQYDRARVASRQILRTEDQRAGLMRERQNVESTASDHTTFTQYGLEQLRERHAALARQVADLQSQLDAESQAMRQMTGRHDEMKKLIATLAENETAETSLTTTASSSSPALNPKPVLPDQMPQPPLNPTPLVEAAREQAPGLLAGTDVASLAKIGGRTPKNGTLIAEVPYEDGSSPMVSRLQEGDSPDRTNSTGTRQYFWRARPVGVRLPVAGKVIFSNPFAGYRHLLIIDHGGGWRTLYGNLTDCPLTAGQPVPAGQLIGRYQARQGAHADPFWFEVRQGVQAVEAKSWPVLPPDWEHTLLVQVP